MRALYLDDDGPKVRDDHPVPVPGPGEALVRIELAGICSTDLELIKGYAGFRGVLGHEFVGVVEATADEEHSKWIGRRVVGTINLACRDCEVCGATGAEHCPNRTVLGIIAKDGIFADHATLPVCNLLPVPDAVDDESAVFTEPLAAALRIREQIAVPATARMAVVGPGRLGLLIAQALALGGGRVVVLGRREEHLGLPRDLGFEVGRAEDASDDSFDLVVEATGNDAGFAQSLRLVRPLGTLVLKSTFAGKANLDLTKLVVGEIRVVGSRCGPFEPALRLLRDGAIEVRRMIEGEYALSDALAALEHAARPGVRKILLRP